MALVLLSANLGWIQGHLTFTELSLRYLEMSIEEITGDMGILDVKHLGTMSTDGDNDRATSVGVGPVTVPVGYNITPSRRRTQTLTTGSLTVREQSSV